MQLSKHAKTRSQQREIPKDYIEMIMEYGTPTRKPGNALEYKLHKKNRDRVISHLKHLIAVVDKCTKKAVLVDADSDCDIITVYNLT
jgi:hypothetical protein